MRSAVWSGGFVFLGGEPRSWAWVEIIVKPGASYHRPPGLRCSEVPPSGGRARGRAPALGRLDGRAGMDRDTLIKRLMATFLGELDEHVRSLNRDLLALDGGAEGRARSDAYKSLLRSAHSLKGGGAVGVGGANRVGQPPARRVVHRREGRSTRPRPSPVRAPVRDDRRDRGGRSPAPRASRPGRLAAGGAPAPPGGRGRPPRPRRSPPSTGRPEVSARFVLALALALALIGAHRPGKPG